MKYNGFIALTTVLILSAIFLSLVISITTYTLVGASTNTALYRSNTAELLAESCIEYALIELQRALDYSGSESILIDEESCDILPIQGTGNIDRTIQTESTVEGYTYRIEVVVGEINPVTQITSWDAVTHF